MNNNTQGTKKKALRDKLKRLKDWIKKQGGILKANGVVTTRKENGK